MAFISRAAEYAIRAMLDVASTDEKAVARTKEVAEHQGIPKVFLPKIVQRLAQAGLLRAHKGAAGGITLAGPASGINLRQIIEAIDGPVALNNCLIMPDECPRQSICPIHEVWIEAQQDLLASLEGMTLDRLVNRRKELVSRQVVY